MHRTPATVVAVAAACLSGAVLTAGPAAAESPKVTCPDSMTPTLAVAVKNGDKKDKNGDGFVCAKPAQCTNVGSCNSGPDYDAFGLPLEGLDGTLYYVADNI